VARNGRPLPPKVIVLFLPPRPTAQLSTAHRPVPYRASQCITSPLTAHRSVPSDVGRALRPTTPSSPPCSLPCLSVHNLSPHCPPLRSLRRGSGFTPDNPCLTAPSSSHFPTSPPHRSVIFPLSHLTASPLRHLPPFPPDNRSPPHRLVTFSKTTSASALRALCDSNSVPVPTRQPQRVVVRRSHKYPCHTSHSVHRRS